METTIGVFASRDEAEGAVKELLERGVPEESIVFLTRSESEAKTIAKELGTFVGGFLGGAAGMTTGVVAATLLLPGIGTVFALGIGAAALLTGAGAGAGAGSTLGCRNTRRRCAETHGCRRLRRRHHILPRSSQRGTLPDRGSHGIARARDRSVHNS